MTGMRTKGEQMRGRVVADSGATHSFPVEGKWLIGLRHQSCLHPGGNDVFERRHIQLGEHPAIERTRWTEKPTWTKEPSQEEMPSAAPLADRFTMITVAQQRGNKAGEQEGQVRA